MVGNLGLVIYLVMSNLLHAAANAISIETSTRCPSYCKADVFELLLTMPPPRANLGRHQPGVAERRRCTFMLPRHEVCQDGRFISLGVYG